MGFLMATSISAAVVQSGVYNYLGKGACKEKGNTYLFNAVSYIICIIIFAVLTAMGKVSLFSVAVGVLYGVMTAMSNGYKMIALGKGPMHLTTLIITASMIIPTMSGFIFFGEAFSLIKLIGIIFLLFFIYLSLEKGNGSGKINKKWLLFCGLCFITTGMIGILQKVHQSSVHKDETAVFLLAAFMCSLVYSFAMSKKLGTTLKFNAKYHALAVICGLCTFANHYLNLILSGIVPSQIFFPLVNALPMILIIIMSVVLFKEEITKRQVIGIVGGIASLGCICMLG